MKKERGFMEMWYEAIISDPNWQYEDLYEELYEENPELAEAFAEAVWKASVIEILVINRLARQGIYL